MRLFVRSHSTWCWCCRYFSDPRRIMGSFISASSFPGESPWRLYPDSTFSRRHQFSDNLVRISWAARSPGVFMLNPCITNFSQMVQGAGQPRPYIWMAPDPLLKFGSRYGLSNPPLTTSTDATSGLFQPVFIVEAHQEPPNTCSSTAPPRMFGALFCCIWDAFLAKFYHTAMRRSEIGSSQAAAVG